MITFSSTILKFQKKGEKTGWSYVEISKRQAEQLKPNARVSFRVKGYLDSHPIKQAALLPMGEGKFILPLNGSMRKAIGKQAGDRIVVKLGLDESPLRPSADFIKCLKDDPGAFDYFKTLPKSHQNYFSKWIESAKTFSTKARRITMALMALSAKQGYGEMGSGQTRDHVRNYCIGLALPSVPHFSFRTRSSYFNTRQSHVANNVK